jgi:hypothetical protein
MKVRCLCLRSKTKVDLNSKQRCAERAIKTRKQSITIIKSKFTIYLDAYKTL